MATDISKSDNLMSPQLIQHKRIPPHMTFKIQLCQIVKMYMTKLERMYINKHYIFRCSKSKTIHGSKSV